MKSKFKNISSFILSKRLLFIFAALLMCSGEMWATDYIITCNNKYMAVDNSGNLVQSSELTSGCIWKAVKKNETSSDAVTPTTSQSCYLYTIVNSKTYWLSFDGLQTLSAESSASYDFKRDNSGRFYRDLPFNDYYICINGSGWGTYQGSSYTRATSTPVSAFYYSASAEVNNSTVGTVSVTPTSGVATTDPGQASATTSLTYTATIASGKENLYEFAGWSTDGTNIISGSNVSPYTYTATITSTNSSSPTAVKLTAIFKPLSKLKVISNSADFGYVYSCGDSPSTASDPCSGKLTSDVTTRDDGKSHTMYMYAKPVHATISGVDVESYKFKGWSSTNSLTNIDGGTTRSGQTVTVGSPEYKEFYAMFVPYWKFSANASATLNGAVSAVGGTATASVDQSEIESTDGSGGSRSTTARFSATPNSGYAFAGWAKDASKTEPDKDGNGNLMVSNPYTPTLTNETTGTTVNLTLYAIFYKLVDPSSMTVTPLSIEMSAGSTQDLTVTLAPEKCHQNVTFTGYDTNIISLSDEGLTRTITAKQHGSTTITVTSYKQDNTTVAFTQTVTVKVMEQIPTPVITVEPDASTDYNTALVTIEAGAGSPTVAEGLDIRYTTDGTEPTQALSQPYHGQFSLNNGSTVKVRAFCTDWYPSEIVSEVYNKQITSKPTIKISLNSSNQYEVTFSCKDDDVTYYYTTDGRTPTYDKTTGNATGSTKKYTGAFVPTEAECIITVIATHAEWRDSDAATKNYVRASGSDGSTVYINDYEDHTWTYYSGIGDMSSNPYSYPTRLYSPNPRNVKIIYDANGAKVSLESTENETKFIYYETLEQGSTSGQYPYTVISNPFSKRPTGQGFAGWKILSGGEYISGKSNDDLLSLDETITFVNLPYPSVNCTSAIIELQATWTTATVKNATSGTITFNGGTYETNFVVMKSSSSSTLTLNSPCTVMAVEPDGSADYRSNTFSGTISPNNSTMSKIEFVNWQGGNRSEFSAEGKNVTIGRGLTTSSTTISQLYGCSDNNTANQVFKIESGKYTYFDNYYDEPKSITKQYVIFGCDYDRAKNDNTKLNITSNMYIANQFGPTSSSDVEVCRVYSKSGQFLTSKDIGTATASQSYYFGFSNAQTSPGYRYLEFQGGIWHNIAGGMGTNHDQNKLAVEYRMKGGTILGSIYGAAEFANAAGIRKFVFTGGTINGWVAGGANGNSSSGGGQLNGETFIYIGGRCQVTSNNSTTIINEAVGGNVFGAGCGLSFSSTSGIVTNGTNVVLADEAYVERGVYGGGGFGYTTSTANLFITGGHCGGVKGGVNKNGSGIDSNLQGGIFGGHCQNEHDGGAVNILMTGGTIEGGLFGGCNNYGNNSSVDIKIAGGQIGTKTNLATLACGGGYGNNTTISGNVTMTLGVNDLTDSDGNALSPYFYGNCYGGAALGSVTGNVAMTINKGSSYQEGADNTGGEIFCGGLGQSGNTSYGKVGGTLTTVIEGTDDKPGDGKYAYNHIYGGSHYINQTSTTPSVTVKGCNVSIKKLYGGSKEATIAGTNITVNGGNTIGYLFGGSYKAQVLGDVNLTIGAGAAEHVFGGNDLNYDGSESDYTGANIKSNITGDIIMSIDKSASAATCSMYLGEVYGGGNQADSKSTTIKIGCPGYIGQLYGGANEANIDGSIALTVKGGNYGTIFGGNNVKGVVKGAVAVQVGNNEGDNSCDLSVGTIFGGGNLADLSRSENAVTVKVYNSETQVGNVYGGGKLASVYSTEVYIYDGQFSGNVFGGGMGSKETTELANKEMILSGGTNLNITGGTLTNVFGGNDAGGTITGALNTKINKNTTSLDINGDVYGGGNEADSNVGQLEITCVDHVGNVYGGAKNANITGNIGLKIGAGDIDNVFGGNNLGGGVSGTITIDVQHAGCNVISIGNLYGAGNLADYTSPTTDCNPVINLNTCGQTTVDWANDGTHCLKVGNIFGGGKGTADTEGEYVGKGKVIGNPQINVKAGEIGNIYGGGNIADVEGNTYVNVIDEATGDNQDIYVTGNIYGGGNEAAVSGETNVQIGPKK